MTKPYTPAEQAWVDQLQQHYDNVSGGVCMAAIRYSGTAPADPCEGKIGDRHAIARRHLRLVANTEDRIWANKEIASFEKWPEKYPVLQSVPITQFSAGKWSCQKHDERFAGIDSAQIDLSDSENLFKAIYRAVLRHNHLSMARWTAVHELTRTEEGWRFFKATAFDNPVTEEEATNALNHWGRCAQSLMSKTKEFEQRLLAANWNSLDYRAALLQSTPAIAGWGCRLMSFDTRGLPNGEFRQGRQNWIDFVYIVVIPQDNGHAIITACEKDTRFRVPEVRYIHDSMPAAAPCNLPYEASEKMIRRISDKIWGLNELGFSESLHRSWSTTDQRMAQQWMKQGRSHLLTHPERAPEYLPCLLQ